MYRSSRAQAGAQRKKVWLWPVGIGLLSAGSLSLIAQTTAQAPPVKEEPGFGFNLLTNSGFEGDWYNSRPEIMSCPAEPRVQFGQCDGIVDGWKSAAECQRTRDAYSGQYALTIPAGKTLSQDQVGYGLMTKDASRAAPLRVSAWVKGGAGSAEVVLSSSDPAVGEITKKSQPFAAAAGWTKVTMDVPAAEVEAALKAKATPAGSVSAALNVSATGGAVAIDDVRLERPYLPSPYSLVPNPGFEAIDAQGAPSGWSRARKSLRHVGATWYYIWRKWYHPLGVPRGANEVDNLVVAAGKRSFRMNVPPGDEKYIETAAIALNQTAPRRMAIRFDYNSYMLANLIVQVVDEQGQEVLFDVVQPGTTGGWHSYQRMFVPAPVKANDTPGGAGVANVAGASVALKNCRVRIGVRGVNGSNQDDINEWVNVNHAGVLWFDNIALTEVDSTSAEMTARGAKTYNLEQEAAPLVVESIDLGERLYGQNRATMTVLNTGKSAMADGVTMTVSGPYREDDPQKAGYAMGMPAQQVLLPQPKKAPDQTQNATFQVKPGQRTTMELPYTISTLTEDWRSEYRVKIALPAQKQATDMTFGTWSQQVLVEVLKVYSYPDETEQTVSLNIGVARDTLARTQSVKVQALRAADDQVVLTHDISNFPQAAATFNLTPLPAGWQGDDTNFHQVNLNISKLPVHPQTQPVRDHYIRVQGLDTAGKETFRGISPRFGRMEVHTEKLDPIQNVEMSKDNYLVINGKPFFNRGHLQMQQNFGPSPFSHQPMDFKKTGFNTAGNGQAAMEAQKSLESVWDQQNLYWFTRKIEGKPPMTEATKEYIKKQVSHPGVIGLNYVTWEGEPEGGTDEERLQYVRDIKAVANGHPLWLSAGWYSPTVNGIVFPDYLAHDIFSPENNSYFQPSQIDREVLTKKMARGEAAVLNTFPNVFNDMPWEVQRFEHWTELIRHHTGYTIIGITGDPTLFRGMNGEMRFIESFLFSKDKAPAVTAAPNVEHMVRSNAGKTYIMATNSGPTIGGDWKWNTQLKDKGVASHTGDALWSRYHPFMKDYHNHFYKADRPVAVRKGDKIAQYVFIPNDAKVESLALSPRGNGDWNYHAVWGKWDHKQFTDSGARMWLGKDTHQMFWGTIGFAGPEGANPQHPKLLKYIFTESQFHKLGALPAPGKWVRLEVPVETLGLDGQVIDGFNFLSKGDNVWWERTLLVRDAKEITLCDGSVGINPAQLKSVRFNVPGLKAGAKVKVVFDEREIVAKDGYFEDDLTGKPGYQNVWAGIYGDKIGESGYYGDGVFYNYNFGRIAARLYEMPS